MIQWLRATSLAMWARKDEEAWSCKRGMTLDDSDRAPVMMCNDCGIDVVEAGEVYMLSRTICVF
jgi:hypothetical protein